MSFEKQFIKYDKDRFSVHADYRANENELLARIKKIIKLTPSDNDEIITKATKIVEAVRSKRLATMGLDAFFIQYDLSSAEGIALMCLAEAMLRVPDNSNIDTLIKDKLTNLGWKQHTKNSASWLVNAATWGLVATDKLYSSKNTLQSLVSRLGEPVVREFVKKAMGLLGEQFILGNTIEAAIKRANKKANKEYLYSYDMLGEAAKTAADAEKYFADYKHSIKAIADCDGSSDLLSRPGISVKLSALYPRYQMSQYTKATSELCEKLTVLVYMAKEKNITVTLDAEEADRMELSLEVFAKLLQDEAIASWGGFGLAVQAYQKRALSLIDYLAILAKQENAKILVRLVKGAYWDTEIKLSQVMGLNDYPVFTRKFNTDACYLACVTKIAAFQGEIYGQYATHNAHTVAAVLQIYGTERSDFEFQCLHGMGRTLYDAVLATENNIRCRMYAPVGNHQELLPYLVRRLLENGANSSFVNRIIDKKIPIASIVKNPLVLVDACESSYHPNIPLPRNMLGSERLNSKGLDISNPLVNIDIATNMTKYLSSPITADLLVSNLSKVKFAPGKKITVTNPANRSEVVGYYHEVNEELVSHALAEAKGYYNSWSKITVADRADIFMKAADKLEDQMTDFMALAIKEAGKHWQDAIDEVREAVDFLRYYAVEANNKLSTQILPGPTGELNQLSYVGRGVVFCISPWNFPLAIFCGQLSAALIAGNTVIAKPASSTVLIATKFIELLFDCGLPREAVQLVPGPSVISGTPIVTSSNVQAVMLTGSNATAKSISKDLSSREGAIVPLIAETGGMNSMIVDSTALTEQVVQDVIDSAYKSAGQRCSALRVLYVQEEVFDKTVIMLKGAMAELIIGDPSCLNVDVGPVIDERAYNALMSHVEYLSATDAELLYETPSESSYEKGTFFMPRMYKISGIELLKEEVFGPVLHIVSYKLKDLDKVIDAINDTGFGLTFGIHSRIESTAEYIRARIKVGNVYINRNTIGAVVGVQPFGGEGLSGTGPKAGGPNYLLRLCHERTLTVNTAAVGGNTSLMTLEDPILD
jgi:RHH-type transcriptional regulator, proline utilization regulon repressor / proline dehydrogenase / delta 1-pyrroline-5-carboxylate dehydrogenase